jgi:hypothetical protein
VKAAGLFLEQKAQKEQSTSSLSGALLSKAGQLSKQRFSFLLAKETAARRQLGDGGGGEKALAKATRLLLGSAGALSTHLVEGGKGSARTSGLRSVAKQTQDLKTAVQQLPPDVRRSIRKVAQVRGSQSSGFCVASRLRGADRGRPVGVVAVAAESGMRMEAGTRPSGFWCGPPPAAGEGGVAVGRMRRGAATAGPARP